MRVIQRKGQKYKQNEIERETIKGKECEGRQKEKSAPRVKKKKKEKQSRIEK